MRKKTWLAFVAIVLIVSTAFAVAQGRPQARTLDPDPGISVILLGTGVPIPNPQRGTACTAVIAGDRAFLDEDGPTL